MCMTVASYYLVCGHCDTNSIPCLSGTLYEAGLSNEYCQHSRSYTSWLGGDCDTCTLLRDLEVLRFDDPHEPLIWMNHVYRASLTSQPAPPDTVIEDNLNLALASDQRTKTYSKRSSEYGVPSDHRSHNKEKRVACQVPLDIFEQSSACPIGRGTSGTDADRGGFEKREHPAKDEI